MRLSILGGGPGGLYAALLLKKEWPAWEITVHERNRADDTFGFGVVFSDETLGIFRDADRPSYEAIRRNFAYWDDVEIVLDRKGIEDGDPARFRVAGNGFAGCSRQSLLLLLQERCRDLGVELSFEDEIDDDRLDGLLESSDLLIAADGINSRVRARFEDELGVEVTEGANHFCWLGSSRELDAFEYFFRDVELTQGQEQGERGPLVAHCYQYEPGRSTWVLELPERTWRGLGMDELDDAAAEHVPVLEAIYERELDGHPLLDNRSLWRRFPTVRCERWWVPGRRDDHSDRNAHCPVVLLGDAKATAHYSVGAGTKLAMEDAIGLVDALRDSFGGESTRALGDGARIELAADLSSALERYQELRADEVGKTQHSADVSAQWFEAMERHWHLDARQFAFGVMSRSKQITYENLALRDRAFVGTVEEWFLDEVRRSGFEVHPGTPPMFTPFRLREMTVPNRVVVSPMAQYKASDGVPGDWHFQHLASRALGGAGLVFVEMTCVSPEGRITPGCTGLWNEEQRDAFRRVVDFVHAESPAKLCLQIGHSGRKGSTQVGWEEMDHPLPDDSEQRNWPLVSASPAPWFDGISQVPRELDRAGMDEIRDQFVRSAELAEAAGFDMLEVHLAHGYLLASFLSPLTNRRTDEYGGDVGARMSFPLEVVEAVRSAWPEDKPLSARISASDWAPGGIEESEIVTLAKALGERGVDLVDVSAGQTVPWQKPVYGRMFQTPFADLVRQETGLATMSVGNITSADQVNTILLQGRSDLVALARHHLTNPSFTHHAAAWYGVGGEGRRDQHPWPKPYWSGRDQALRMAEKDREEDRRAKEALKPASHDPALDVAADGAESGDAGSWPEAELERVDREALDERDDGPASAELERKSSA